MRAGWSYSYMPSPVCFARLNYVTVESRGTGSSAKTAVYDAITEALGQVNGMQIASQTPTTSSSAPSMTSLISVGPVHSIPNQCLR